MKLEHFQQALTAATILGVVGIGHASIPNESIIPEEILDTCAECEYSASLRLSCNTVAPRGSNPEHTLTAASAFEIGNLGGGTVGVALLNPGEPLEESFAFSQELPTREGFRRFMFTQSTHRPLGQSEVFASLVLSIDANGSKRGSITVNRRGRTSQETSIRCE